MTENPAERTSSRIPLRMRISAKASNLELRLGSNQVRCWPRIRVSHRRPEFPSATDAFEMGNLSTHQPPHAFAAVVVTLGGQLRVHAWNAVGADQCARSGNCLTGPCIPGLDGQIFVSGFGRMGAKVDVISYRRPQTADFGRAVRGPERGTPRLKFRCSPESWGANLDEVAEHGISGECAFFGSAVGLGYSSGELLDVGVHHR